MSMLWMSLFLAMSGLQTQAVDIPAMPNFDPKKMAGVWYTVAAGSDCEQFMQMKPVLQMSKILISNLENGDLEIAEAFPMQNECVTRNIHYKMIAPGQYTESEVAQSNIKFIATDYTIYALEYSELIDQNDVPCTRIQLYARNPLVPPLVVPLLQGLMTLVGLEMKHMALLMKGADCDPVEA